jgi:hypothetical protein
MNPNDVAFVLKLTLVVVMLTHSVPGMFNGGVDAFGRL